MTRRSTTRRTTRAAAAGLALCAVGFLGGCGGGHRALDAAGAHLLQAEVQAARDAAANGDFSGARSRLSSVQQTVVLLRRDDKISPDRASAVLTAVQTVDRALGATEATTTSSTLVPTTSVPPPTPTTRPPHPDDKKHGKGNGNDNGG